MSNTLSEKLSALVDDEVDELALRRLLATLDQTDDDEVEHLLKKWSRYHMISDSLSMPALRKDSMNEIASSESFDSVFADDGFAERVSAAVAADSADRVTQHLSSVARKPSQWRGLAVAASVAFAVVVGVQEFDRYGSKSGQPLLANGGQIMTPSVVQQSDFVALRSLESVTPTADSALSVNDVSAVDQLKAA